MPPLAGCRILLTRDASEAAAFVEPLTAEGASVFPIPMICTATKTFAFPDLEPYDWLFFTSQKAVEAFFSTWKQTGARAFTAKIGAVGAETARTVTSFGLEIVFVPDVYQARQAAEDFLKHLLPAALPTMLWPCGNRAASDFGCILQTAGIAVDRLEVYETSARTDFSGTEHAALREGFEAIAFTSPSAVETFKNRAFFPQGADLCAIGPSTAARVRELLGPVALEANPRTLKGLADGMLRLFSQPPAAGR